MGEYTQENRWIQVFTPLGVDELLLQSFQGQEGVSQLFQFDLEMHSENRNIRFEEIVGQNVTVTVHLSDGSVRFINGVINSFLQGGSSPLEGGLTPAVFTHYHATLVPWLWHLTRSSDCRIFQNMTVPDIITKVFKDAGFNDFANRLYGSFEPREYCVQYRETDFNFVSRLMEEEGIFYFFEHESGKHTLVLANRQTEFKPSPLHLNVSYKSLIGEQRNQDVVSEWGLSQQVRPGQYTLADFNFRQPSLDLKSTVVGKDERRLEVYDYPGEYQEKAQGERLAGIRMEEAQMSQVAISGASSCRGFTPGYRFDLRDHYRRDFNKSYVLTSVYHAADQGTNYRSTASKAAADFHYSNRFQCIPHPTPFRPPRLTPVPIVHGTQTAIVVGPPGEEIYVDKYGRVKVQFHWDREGRRDENSSCWIRVSQPWAGKNWGGISIPRIGQEVIVDFLEGDPDQPIITGRVYNGESMPPYALPAGMVVSGIKSQTDKGKGYNGLSMDDTAGKEQVTIHGQYDMNTTVEHDQTTTVHNNRTDQIDVDDSETVGNNQTVQIGSNQKLTVGANQETGIGGNQTLTVQAKQETTIGASRQTTVIATDELVVNGSETISVVGPISISSNASITLSVGASQIVITPAGVTITAPMIKLN